MISQLSKDLIEECQENVNGIMDHGDFLMGAIMADGSLGSLPRADKDIIARAINRIQDIRRDLNEFMLRRAVDLSPGSTEAEVLTQEMFEVIKMTDDQDGDTVFAGTRDACIEYIRKRDQVLDSAADLSLINTKTKRHVSYVL